MKKKMIKLTIKRSQWLHGEGSADSRLLRSKDKKMCCLGFLAMECGAKQKDIKDLEEPDCAPTVKWPSGTFHDDDVNRSTTPLLDQLMLDNDCPSREMTDATREKKIIAGMKKLGISVKFIGKS